VRPGNGQFTGLNLCRPGGGDRQELPAGSNEQGSDEPPMKDDMMDETSTTETVAAAELRQIIERIERLEEEKAAIQGDIKDVIGEAKGRGYDTKAIRTIIRLRKKDANERIEEETILQTYMAALGME
jgi:uncharacterized protein (UPF0335 family)